MAWNPIIVDGGSPFRIRYPKEFTATYEYVPTNERSRLTLETDGEYGDIDAINVHPRKSSQAIRSHHRHDCEIKVKPSDGGNIKVKLNAEDQSLVIDCYPLQLVKTADERESTSTDQHVGIKKITVEKVFGKEYKKHNKLTFHTDDETEQEVAQA